MQVSSVSQSLAEGATEQSNNIQNISDALEELLVQTGDNAKTANEASDLAQKVQQYVTEGQKHMTDD